MQARHRHSTATYVMAAMLLGAGCGDDAGTNANADAGAGFCQSEAALDLAVCDPSAGGFSLTIDNPYYPLVVGQVSVLEGEEDGEAMHVEIEVMNETETVAGVETRVVEEREKADGEIVEISRNFFAQASDGTVCYFGEDVDIYEGGEVVSREGATQTTAQAS